MNPPIPLTWVNWALLALNILAEGAVLYLSLRKRLWKFLVMLPAFAAFCLVFDLGSTVILLTGNPKAVWFAGFYFVWYWTLQYVASIVVLILALQVVTLVLPPWKALLSVLAVILFGCMAATLAHLLPAKNPGDLLAALTIADVIAVLALPAMWVVHPSEWPQGIKMVTAGLLISTLLQVGFSVGAAFLHTMVGLFTVGIPAASLVGMIFFTAAVCRLPIHAKVKREMGNANAHRLSLMSRLMIQRTVFVALQRAERFI